MEKSDLRVRWVTVRYIGMSTFSLAGSLRDYMELQAVNSSCLQSISCWNTPSGPDMCSLSLWSHLFCGQVTATCDHRHSEEEGSYSFLHSGSRSQALWFWLVCLQPLFSTGVTWGSVAFPTDYSEHKHCCATRLCQHRVSGSENHRCV